MKKLNGKNTLFHVNMSLLPGYHEHFGSVSYQDGALDTLSELSITKEGPCGVPLGCSFPMLLMASVKCQPNPLTVSTWEVILVGEMNTN